MENKKRMKTKIEHIILTISNDLEEVILEYLQEKDMTGWSRYFDDHYSKEFSRNGLSVNQETLWGAINSLISRNEIKCSKTVFLGEKAVVITPFLFRKSKTEKVSTLQNRRNRQSSNKTGKIVGKLSKEEYNKIREDSIRLQKQLLNGVREK